MDGAESVDLIGLRGDWDVSRSVCLRTQQGRREMAQEVSNHSEEGMD